MDIGTAIIAHLVGDYLLQNDWMANGKKTSSLVCLVHVVAYSLPFIFFGIPVAALLLICVQHFIQDRTSFVDWFMFYTGKEKFASPPMAPWSKIVIDNTFHLLFIFLVLKFI